MIEKEKPMDLRLIRYFLVLCEEENFTVAANRLNITQPTLSKEIKNLELELNNTLLIRGKRKITLTDEGLYLKKHGKEIIELSEKLEQGIKNYNNDIQGDVYIGAAETELFHIISKTMHDVSLDYPKIQFHIYDGNTDDIENRIDTGSISFGLIFSTNQHDKYEYLPIYGKDQWGVILKKEDPLAVKNAVEPQDLIDKPLILSSRKKSHATISNWFGKDIKDLNVFAYINLLSNGLHLVRDDCGYCIAISELSHDSELVFRPLSPEIYQYPTIIYKKNSSFSRAEKIFLSYLKESILKNKQQKTV